MKIDGMLLVATLGALTIACKGVASTLETRRRAVTNIITVNENDFGDFYTSSAESPVDIKDIRLCASAPARPVMKRPNMVRPEVPSLLEQWVALAREDGTTLLLDDDYGLFLTDALTVSKEVKLDIYYHDKPRRASKAEKK